MPTVGVPLRSIVLAVVLGVGLSACAAPRARQSGGSCLDQCREQYKDCAYGSECMMVQECIMDICIPAENECRVRCTASAPAGRPAAP